ncbi:MAG: ATP-binding cassette domain-containing protein [Alphaproteobacteria bacterium]|nr:ATP-binding cassette domain-containing protein [Alphaproteobacteria bacterium]
MSDRAPRTGSPALALDRVTRTYHQGEHELVIFRELSVSIAAGEIVALVGPSGAGKSSLLHIAGLLETPTSGDILIAGRHCTGLEDAERTRIRREEIGFVYQFHHLWPEFSALENVAMPLRIGGLGAGAARERAAAMLERLGLASRLEHRPGQLSGGEQQRVAIARALIARPKILLADEPTGNLDTRTSGTVFEALLALVRGEGLAALIATHNPALATAMDRTLYLSDGRLSETAPAAA